LAENYIQKTSSEIHLAVIPAPNRAVKETIPTMKKLIILTPLLAVALALTSCTTVVEKPAPTTTTTSTTVKKSTVPVTQQETTTTRY